MDSASLDSFLQSLEQKAYRIAVISLRSPEDALDVVQDSMLRFVEKYRNKPASQWKPLFYRILYNCIASERRKRLVRNKFFSWLTPRTEEGDPIAEMGDMSQPGPEHCASVRRAYALLEQKMLNLSYRQQQAFMLRAHEDLSVAETALAMQCSEGSVKTHYARALENLRTQLGDQWP